MKPIIGSVALVAANAFATAAEAAPFTLACDVKAVLPVADGSYPTVALPVLVSPEHGTVNGDPAAITDTLISWTDNSGHPDDAVSYIIDRKKMEVGVYGDGSHLFASGKCVAPTPSASAAGLSSASPSSTSPTTPAQQSGGDNSAGSGPFTLACRMESFNDHRPLGDQGYLVDPRSSTVDGRQAEFTTRYIKYTWDDGKKKDAYRTVIDRITGTILISRKGELLLEGTCALATGPKF